MSYLQHPTTVFSADDHAGDASSSGILLWGNRTEQSEQNLAPQAPSYSAFLFSMGRKTNMTTTHSQQIAYVAFEHILVRACCDFKPSDNPPVVMLQCDGMHIAALAIRDDKSYALWGPKMGKLPEPTLAAVRRQAAKLFNVLPRVLPYTTARKLLHTMAVFGVTEPDICAAANLAGWALSPLLVSAWCRPAEAKASVPISLSELAAVLDALALLPQDRLDAWAKVGDEATKIGETDVADNEVSESLDESPPLQLKRPLLRLNR